MRMDLLSVIILGDWKVLLRLWGFEFSTTRPTRRAHPYRMGFTGNISRERSYRCRCSDFENWRLQIEPSLRTMIAAGTRIQNQLRKAWMSWAVWAVWSILFFSHVIPPLVLFHISRLILAVQSGSHSTENNRCLGLHLELNELPVHITPVNTRHGDVMRSPRWADDESQTEKSSLSTR